MLDYLRIHENTRCFLAGFQCPKLRKYLYVMMEVFKFTKKTELRDAVMTLQVPAILEDTLNEYIIETEPDDFFVQLPLQFEPVLSENETLNLVSRRMIC